MKVCSVSGYRNGVPIGCVGRDYEPSLLLPERYRIKKKSAQVKRLGKRRVVSKLSDDQIYDIRDMGDADISPAVAGRKHGITESYACQIINRKKLGPTYLPERKNPNDSCQHLFAKRKS